MEFLRYWPTKFIQYLCHATLYSERLLLPKKKKDGCFDVSAGVGYYSCVKEILSRLHLNALRSTVMACEPCYALQHLPDSSPSCGSGTHASIFIYNRWNS